MSNESRLWLLNSNVSPSSSAQEKLAELQEQMKRSDKTMHAWSAHLHAACRYLATNGLIAVLYRMQVSGGRVG